MEAVIVNYRQGGNRQYNNEMIVQVNDIDNKEKAKSLVGKKILWLSSTKKEFIGIIKKQHGNKGALRVRFDKGLPGQAIGNKAKVMDK